MTTIDHLGFPHIVELIFQYAPVESLVVMGRTCHEWMERVIDELYHLRDFSIERPNSAPGGDNGLPDWYRFETTSGRSVTVTEPAFLPFCKVIDLASELQYEEREDHTLAVDTVRLPRPFPSENPDLGCLVPFACSRVVLDNHFRLRTLREIPKLVVNFHYEGYNSHRVLWRPLPEGIRVHELVFIVDPYVSRCGVREAREDSEDRGETLLPPALANRSLQHSRPSSRILSGSRTPSGAHQLEAHVCCQQAAEVLEVPHSGP